MKARLSIPQKAVPVTKMPDSHQVHDSSSQDMSVSPDAESRTRSTVHVSSIEVSGPLPSPAMLYAYEQVKPGFAERIVRMAEEAERHQQQMDVRLYALQKEAVTYDHKERLAGLGASLLCILIVMAAISFQAYQGQYMATGLIVALGAIVCAFIGGDNYLKQKRRSKRSKLHQAASNDTMI